MDTQQARDIIAAEDGLARALANLRNAGAMSADDPRSQQLLEDAGDGYAAAIARLAAVQVPLAVVAAPEDPVSAPEPPAAAPQAPEGGQAPPLAPVPPQTPPSEPQTPPAPAPPPGGAPAS